VVQGLLRRAAQGSLKDDIVYADSYWHVDGVLEWKNQSATKHPSKTINCNHMPRLLRHDETYGWQAHTKISCLWKVHDTLPLCRCAFFELLGTALTDRPDLILVDLPIEQRCAVACSMLPSVQVHLPLALNRGGLVLSKLSNRSILSLHDCLDQFLSH
jgi:hypothetical protein